MNEQQSYLCHNAGALQPAVPCRFGENELASLSYSIALASAPVEGTVFGTKGHIQIHDALHHSTRLSVHLAGGSAAYGALHHSAWLSVHLAGGSAAWLQPSSLSCWHCCTKRFRRLLDWRFEHWRPATS